MLTDIFTFLDEVWTGRDYFADDDCRRRAMNALGRMLVAVDGSPPALAAVDLALRVAVLPRRSAVRFVGVAESATGASVPAHAALEDAAIRAAAVNVEATCTLREDADVADALLDEARSSAASALVMGTYGHADPTPAPLGRLTLQLLRRSLCPVLVAQPGARGSGTFARILCAFDGSPAARRAFDGAVAIAAERGAELHVLSVVQLDDVYASRYESDGYDPGGTIGALYTVAQAPLTALADDARALGVSVNVRIAGGADVAATIIGRAAQFSCDLSVIGTHGRRGFERELLGSTAEAVIRTTRLPVLAFREPLARRGDMPAAGAPQRRAWRPIRSRR
jgi:nucleotide-binding universal stress UspA family protein